MRFRAARQLLMIGFLLMLSATGGCKTGEWKLWNAYSARFIDAHGRVFDPQGDQHSTSEGESYAMFLALAANDRKTFDNVLNWTQANLASGNLGAQLPAWLWGKSGDGSWKVLDANSASDADLWMAYSLIEAGRLWNQPEYTTLGLRLAALIAKNEVANLPGFGQMVLPGPVGFQHGNTTTLNPSYLPVFIFVRLASVDPGGPWAQIADNIPRVLQQGSRHGFVMDWVDYVPGDGFFPSSGQVAATATPKPALGSYDAIRVYLWAGMTNAQGGVRGQLLDAIPGMSAYLANHDAPPEKINDQGVPLPQDGPVGFSAALLPYLKAYGASQSNAQQMLRLKRERNSSSGLYGKDLSYYDQNLALFGVGFMDGRFGFGPGGELKVEWKRR